MACAWITLIMLVADATGLLPRPMPLIMLPVMFAGALWTTTQNDR